MEYELEELQSACGSIIVKHGWSYTDL